MATLLRAFLLLGAAAAAFVAAQQPITLNDVEEGLPEIARWFTRSPVYECRNCVSNARSAYAILALQARGELPG